MISRRGSTYQVVVRCIGYAAQNTDCLCFHLLADYEVGRHCFLKLLDRSLTFPVPVLLHVFLAGTLVGSEVLNVLAVHILRDVVGLPLWGKVQVSYTVHLEHRARGGGRITDS
jgi:hypothetical protein